MPDKMIALKEAMKEVEAANRAYQRADKVAEEKLAVLEAAQTKLVLAANAVKTNSDTVQPEPENAPQSA